MTKIVQLVNACGECPNWHYYSGGTYECMKVEGSRLTNKYAIPDWCPLTDYRPETLRARRPLTEEQIIDATDHVSMERPGVFVFVARAIERAHGIGAAGVKTVDGAQP